MSVCVCMGVCVCVGVCAKILTCELVCVFVCVNNLQLIFEIIKMNYPIIMQNYRIYFDKIIHMINLA